MLHLSHQAVTHYFDNLQRHWSYWLLNHPLVFEDNGVYEVDECIIMRIRDRFQDTILSHLWLGGIIERETGKVKLYHLRDRSANSILPPIRNSVPAGAYIFSDDYACYSQLGRDNMYAHYSINRSSGEYQRDEILNHLETLNIHINTMEAVWRVV